MNIINVAHAGVIASAPKASHIGTNVLNFLLSSVGVIAIMMLVVSGIMYMSAMGDMKQLAKAKKAATYSVIGIIFMFGGMILVRMIGQFFSN